MKVTIREREFDYESDYPDGWKFAARDFFKYPVTIRKDKIEHKCFIKRFESKIPGRQLLINIKGKNEANFPRFHDVVEVEERGSKVNYIFFEFCEGKTLLDINLQNEQVNLKRLNDDLFSAIKSIKANDHWFPDFCEKNIFRDKKGKFLLIDLDSALPVTTAPKPGTDFNMDYWVLVFKFYNEILDLYDFEARDFNGISFNYLQVVFLILRLKEFYTGKEERYADLHNSLPQSLNKTSARFKKIFKKAFKNPDNAFSDDEVKELYNLIDQVIIEGVSPPPPGAEPMIRDFSVSHYSDEKANGFVVYNGQPFTLNWEAATECTLSLYKNGIFDTELENEKKFISIVQICDGKEKKVVYHLQAEYDDRVEPSKPLIIFVNPEPVQQPDPVIHEFISSVSNVRHQEPFSLQWEVENATKIVLYRNGAEYKKLKIQDKSIQLFESYNEDEAEIEFWLTAANEAGQSQSPPLKIAVNPQLIPSRTFNSDVRHSLPPVIHEFISSVSDIRHQEPFSLQWKVENANKIILYRNGAEFKKIKIQDKNIQLFELYDQADNIVEFRLVAANDTGIESSTLTVTVNPVPPRVLPPLIHKFISDKRTVIPREAFLLQWETSNATKIMLYRNGTEYKNINIRDKSIQLEELYDKAFDAVEFKLVALNESGQQSKSLSIKVIREIFVPPVPPPLIHEFITNKLSVKPQEVFLLQWEVENAGKIILYRNGIEFKNINPLDKSVQLAESYDKTAGSVEFKLIVSNESGQQESGPLAIKVIREAPMPVIHEFATDKYSVRHQETFLLKWRLDNAGKITLYRNGAEYRDINIGDKNIQLSEPYNAAAPTVEFRLVVLNDSGQQSNSLRIKVNQDIIVPTDPLLKKIIYAVLVVIALAAIYFLARYFINKNNSKVIEPIKDTVAIQDLVLIDTGRHQLNTTVADVKSLTLGPITAGETLSIPGSNIPVNADSVAVFFNNVAGSIKNLRKDRIQVRIPVLNKKKDIFVNIVVYINQIKFQVANNVVLKNPVLDTFVPPPDSTAITLFQPNETISFNYRPEGQTVYIFVNNRSGGIMRDVKIIIICDSVTGGSHDIELRKEVINARNIAKSTQYKTSASANFFEIYDRSRNKKRIRLQLSYKK